MKLILLSILLLTFTLSCSTTTEPPAKSTEGLSEAQARVRKTQVKDVKYNLSFILNETNKTFSGSTQIDFTWLNSKEQLLVDLDKALIESITVNKVKLPEWTYDQNHIYFNPKLFSNGKNKITIHYSRNYNTDGKGLHYFQDPVDKKVYLYTQFEPDYANKVFPSFDQPDLKATYTLQVTAPNSWKVITSTRETKIVKLNPTQSLWTFAESQKFSTYLLALHAGPYKVWKSKAGSIPLRLFARQSLVKYVKPQRWFRYTQKAFSFFNDFFGIKYPYLKYDQIIAPEFNAGAMENVAAVTFSERYVIRGRATTNQQYSLAETLYHEMAHMWFGNLVTMKWWNDLWLNESFATFMSQLALTKNKEFAHLVWPDFYSTKLWGYSTDEKPTTHPISTPVINTQEAFTNFDGITYAKGGAWLKQTYHLMGNEKFKQGIQNYFKKFQTQNTVLNDFIGELQTANQTSFGKNWVQSWLFTSGANSIRPEFTCKNGKLTQLNLIQKKDKHTKILRTHKLNVALLKIDGQKIKTVMSLPTLVKAEPNTKVSYPRWTDCPDAVYANYQDYAYIKTIIDHKTVNFLSDKMHLIEDSFLKKMIWNSLSDMVDRKELSALKFANTLLKSLNSERKSYKNVNSLRSILIPRWTNSKSTLTYLKFSNLQTEYQEINKKLNALAWKELNNQKVKSDLYQVWVQTFLQTTQTPDSLNQIVTLLNNQKRYQIDQDTRWDLIYVLASYDHPKTQQLTLLEKKKDPSDSAKKALLTINAAQSKLDNKKKWLDVIRHNPNKLSASNLRYITYSLFPNTQDSLREKFKTEILNDLKENKINYRELSRFTALLPACSSQVNKKLGAILAQNKSKWHPSITKSVKSFIYTSDRCVRVTHKNNSNPTQVR